jgi:hypothetical protein
MNYQPTPPNRGTVEPVEFVAATNPLELHAGRDGVDINPLQIFPSDLHGPVNVAQRVADRAGHPLRPQQHHLPPGVLPRRTAAGLWGPTRPSDCGACRPVNTPAQDQSAGPGATERWAGRYAPNWANLATTCTPSTISSSRPSTAPSRRGSSPRSAITRTTSTGSRRPARRRSSSTSTSSATTPRSRDPGQEDDLQRVSQEPAAGLLLARSGAAGKTVEEVGG